jgi:predicted transposase YdaD
MAKERRNHFDVVFKQVLSPLIKHWLPKMLNTQLASLEPMNTGLPKTLERTVDFLAKATDAEGNPFLVHIEYQAQLNDEMVYRLQEYHALLLRQYRLPIKHFVFYFGQASPKFITKLRFEEQFTQFELFDIRSVDYESLLASDLPEEIVLAVLADIKDRSHGEVMTQILQRLRTRCHNIDEWNQRKEQLGIIARLRNILIDELLNSKLMPIDFDITKDTLFLKGMEKGLEKGMEKGEVQGIEKGRLLERKRLERQRSQEIRRMHAHSIPIDIICEVLNVEPEYVNKVLGKKGEV